MANDRIHATTRQRPAERVLLERPRLRPLPPRPFDTDCVLPLIVSKEARVRFDTNTYSVPPECVGKTHLANAIDQLACLRSYRVRWTTAADLVNDLVAAQPAPVKRPP